jgi:hypothetical protein
VQNLDVPAGMDAGDLQRRLGAAGIAAVLRRGACRPGPLLTLVLRADHELPEVERAAAALVRILRPEGRPAGGAGGARSARQEAWREGS